MAAEVDQISAFRRTLLRRASRAIDCFESTGQTAELEAFVEGVLADVRSSFPRERAIADQIADPQVAIAVTERQRRIRQRAEQLREDLSRRDSARTFIDATDLVRALTCHVCASDSHLLRGEARSRMRQS